ncbi:MAG: SRPBCC domain-containing protein [Candidatus Obscuribacterales bacterium]|nr:SRPBCC domain-containing protein [Candidatus Obscuribacterales bacterium]
MGKQTNLTVELEREYTATPGALFSRIKDGTIFKLTGAKQVSIQFLEDGKYHLDFGERTGRHCFIEGQFTRIVHNELVSCVWSVEGFRDEDDKDTILTFSITDLSGSAKLCLKHEMIRTKESADGKRRGWSEVLSDLEACLSD